MIDEKFLLAAVNIRKTYINLISNLNMYEDKARETLEMLNNIYCHNSVLLSFLYLVYMM